MLDSSPVGRILRSRRPLLVNRPPVPRHKAEAEGGCGVVGVISNQPLPGEHLYAPCLQMRNRGNGKGGGLVAAGLSAEQLGVSPQLLKEDYLIQVAFLDPAARPEVEGECLEPYLEIHHAGAAPSLEDCREVEGLEVQPPQVWRYFARVRKELLEHFVAEHGLEGLEPRQAEDEFIYQNTYRLNQRFYASLGEKRAFVLCHGQDMLVFKIVGYAQQALRYYRLEDLRAHLWVGHQRYPTKGRVWHPGGAHPFIGLHEALVHNGDFANYHAVCEYLHQRNIAPLFLTDTEVSVLLFDLWSRVYRYPLEYLIEALAPTTERDFEKLPPEKRTIYRAIQAAHMHGSPDGPWFFIIARSLPQEGALQLLGITDTSMLRPQVFALQEGERQIGVIASEKQAIDALLRSLAQEDPRVCPVADLYWNARGGSHTDGGAFIFTLDMGDQPRRLVCTDKFGKVVTPPHGERDAAIGDGRFGEAALPRVDVTNTLESMESTQRQLASWSDAELRAFCQAVVDWSDSGDQARMQAIELLTGLLDRRYDPGTMRRAWIIAIVEAALYRVLRGVPELDASVPSLYRRIDWASSEHLRPPRPPQEILVVDLSSFLSEGERSGARILAEAHRKGWRRAIVFDCRGQRFQGCGLGPSSQGFRLDVYGSSGDYLGSGLDGEEIRVHGNAQDQVGQILKNGKLAIFGDVGQAFLYGAKGGEVYVLGNAAGRPLINAVGSPRVVINGTCLDYLAESFMAGDPLAGGGFAILNALRITPRGEFEELEEPYPGGNLLSLASGGAVYLRDPHQRVEERQLNGGVFAPFSAADWDLVLPYLEENQRHFGISVPDVLLKVDGAPRRPQEVYRKVIPRAGSVLTE
ncbi:MAG: glutamate synthase [Chloroflexi bacterium]|nr:glutamate synthase [Chloroflexota bacterium]